jgi:hypothetical protein
MPKSLDESLPFFAGSRDSLATSAVRGADAGKKMSGCRTLRDSSYDFRTWATATKRESC